MSESTKTMDDWNPGAAASERPDAGLVLLYADELLTLPSVFALDRDVMLIGREADSANLVIPQRAVSRVHARLAFEGGRWRVRDLGSHNGVVVGGRAVADVPLDDGDELRIGNALFKFVASGAAMYAPYRIDGTVAEGAARTTIAGAVGGLRMARISADVQKVAPSDLSVLVLGETGTGKELVAQALHAASGRRGPLQALNCASIPANLVESELFGHKRGAFSGATRDHIGIVRAAAGGTLLLDEIGDLPLDAQAKLLRVLETREVVPVGAVGGERVDVRIVGSTHRDLRALVASGQFRGDLYARLNGYLITLPPLRDRKEDIALLVRHWLAADRAISFRFMVAMCHYDWPFNVRELAAAVRRAQTIAESGPLDTAHLPEAILEAMESYGGVEAGAPEVPSLLPPPLAPARQVRSARPAPERLVELLTEHEGNISAVARALASDRALVNRWIQAAGLEVGKYRPQG